MLNFSNEIIGRRKIYFTFLYTIISTNTVSLESLQLYIAKNDTIKLTFPHLQVIEFRSILHLLLTINSSMFAATGLDLYKIVVKLKFFMFSDKNYRFIRLIFCGFPFPVVVWTSLPSKQKDETRILRQLFSLIKFFVLYSFLSVIAY